MKHDFEKKSHPVAEVAGSTSHRQQASGLSNGQPPKATETEANSEANRCSLQMFLFFGKLDSNFHVGGKLF